MSPLGKDLTNDRYGSQACTVPVLSPFLAPRLEATRLHDLFVDLVLHPACTAHVSPWWLPLVAVLWCLHVGDIWKMSWSMEFSLACTESSSALSLMGLAPG